MEKHPGKDIWNAQLHHNHFPGETECDNLNPETRHKEHGIKSKAAISFAIQFYIVKQ